MRKEDLLTRDDILHKEPDDGDFGMYFVYDVLFKVCKTEVGIIYKDDFNNCWLINGVPRMTNQLLFVLTFDGYSKQKRLSNPHAL